MAKKEISPERKMMYNVGLGLMIVGFILFLSLFVSVFSFMSGDEFSVSMTNGEPTLESNEPNFIIGLIGFILMGIGGFMRAVAARGVAGSGIILDPDQAREDLKPWTQMAGGMLKDALDETDIKGSSTEKTIVKIRCQNCKALNDEDSKFCKSCGQSL